jgi:hypothetical protein
MPALDTTVNHQNFGGTSENAANHQKFSGTFSYACACPALVAFFLKRR